MQPIKNMKNIFSINTSLRLLILGEEGVHFSLSFNFLGQIVSNGRRKPRSTYLTWNAKRNKKGKAMDQQNEEFEY